MQFLRRATLIAAFVMFALSVAGAVIGTRTNARETMDRQLVAEAESHASTIEAYFERNRALLLLMAQNPAFVQLVSNQDADARAAPRIVAESVGALAFAEQLFPESINEVCLIGRSGAEVARVEHGRIAPADELAADQSGAGFFDETFGLPLHEVHITGVYRSGVGDRDVLGFAAQLPPDESAGSPPAIIHLELSADALFESGDDLDGYGVTIVDLDTGSPAFTDRRSTPSRSARRRILDAAGRSDGPGLVATDGQRLAFRPIDPGRNNENRWLFVASAPEPTLTQLGHFGRLSMATVLAGIVLMALAARGFGAYQRRLEHIARTDSLTGLPNRAHLYDHVTSQIRRCAGGTEFSITIIDLDRFKEVNDTLGHHFGDRVLQAVAHRLLDTLEGAFVARLGGDEFAVVHPSGTGPNRVIESAWRARKSVLRPVDLDGSTVALDASFGIANYPSHGTDADALIQHADVAMYDAKRSGLAVSLYQPEADQHSPHRLQLGADLGDAIAAGAIELHYQPKYRTTTGALCGVEALARWRHPREGSIPPDVFVPIAEQTGQMLALTDLVLDKALGQSRRWLDSGAPTLVSVNVAAHCIADPAFGDRVSSALDRHGVPARLLRLELTESTLVFDPERAGAVFSSLRELGLTLSIDDFGTGWSSLAYLRDLPIDELKIDRAFIGALRSDSREGYIVQSMVKLGHDLGLEVVAEGIEDEATLELVRRFGCDVAQGYHLGRPVPAARLTVGDDVAAPTTGDDPAQEGRVPPPPEREPQSVICPPSQVITSPTV